MASPNEFFVVFGSRGEYSDRTDYLICAYPFEWLAQQHVEAAEQAQTQWASPENEYLYGRNIPELQRWDHKFRWDYTGTRYYYKPVKMRTALPE